MRTIKCLKCNEDFQPLTALSTFCPDCKIVTFDQVLCQRHGQPFREKWPKGYTIFAHKAMRTLLESGLSISSDPPLCCRMSEPQLLEAYAESRIGVSRKCVACGKIRSGTPYQNAKHLCFYCVVHNMRKAS